MTPEQIQKLRDDMELTQQQLADFLGVSIRTVNGWEAGRVVPKPLKMLLSYVARDDMDFKNEINRLMHEVKK
jgi:DNA-binding transcriptional regulator YiaG